MRANVLLAQRGPGLLSYRLPEGTPVGAIVEAPLSGRRVTGVVWSMAGADDTGTVAESALKEAVPLAFPPLSDGLRQLIDFVAGYYLAPPAQVLRMALPRAAFLPSHERRCYRPGAVPAPEGRRKRLYERLSEWASGPEAHGGAPVAAPLAEWRLRLGSTAKTLAALVEAGILVAADPPAAIRAAIRPGPHLRPSQQQAATALADAVAARSFQPFLLEGVTGAGKTEVYLEAVAGALQAGRQALILLPEIALTEALLQRVRRRFGLSPAVWHSALPPAARRDSFRAIAEGRAPIVLGARSALFLPMPAPGLIVVDEAHDAGFKQEDGVPYNGRDVAVMRGRFEGCPVVLATATPPLETLEQVARGTYRHLSLPERHGGATLPAIRTIDLRRTPPPRGQWIAPPLAEALSGRLQRHEQTLLFLNRRGYAPLTLCRQCGARIECPNCTAWLVEHRREGHLLCHHCGYARPIPRTCPACGAEDSLVPCGPGVERLAEEVLGRWPEARVQQVTSDSIRSAADMARLVAAIEAGAVDILIGTQLLAKGHDFPNLTLVGVIDADLGLEGGDLRAAERVFQQIRQVAGRAGRADKPGVVFLQSWQPESRVMQALSSGDSAGFQRAERAARRAAGMPPFSRLAAIVVSSPREEVAASLAGALARAAPPAAGITVWGPAPAPLARLRGRYRRRLLVRASRSAPLQAWLSQWLALLPLPAGARVQVDVDPQSFL